MDGREVIISTSYNKLLKKKILLHGDYSLSPVEGTACEVKLSDVSFKKLGKEIPADRRTVFSSSFSGKFILGEGTNYLDIDFDWCLQHIYCNELCTLQMIYYNKEKEVILEVSCNVKLIKMDEPVLFCDWHWSKKVKRANKHKYAGVELIRRRETLDAFRQFSKALKFLLTLSKVDFESMSDNDKHLVDDLKTKLYNNLAHCQLLYKEYEAAIYLCNRVLEIDNVNVKAIYRRGIAYMGLEFWEFAYTDMTQVLDLDQSVTEANAKIKLLKEKINGLNEAYKRTIRNMFA
ncbi:uncharacterized protein LOC143911408 [Arctopsyche grandis]|uniref:uncharacterized protein LOC143911408 n=1 Tax=Arctopsyche grandis TaxID=121162 RepID=UPI00406D68CE